MKLTQILQQAYEEAKSSNQELFIYSVTSEESPESPETSNPSDKTSHICYGTELTIANLIFHLYQKYPKIFRNALEAINDLNKEIIATIEKSSNSNPLQ